MENKSYRSGVLPQNGRVSRVRRQRSKEWREYPSSSDNEDEQLGHRPYNMDGHYLDPEMRKFTADRARMRIGNDYSSDTEGCDAMEDRHSPRIRQMHNDKSDAISNPYTSLPRSHKGQRSASNQGQQNGSNTNSLQRSRRSINMRHGRSSSSTSDNNSDATYTDSDLALNRRQNDYSMSPPEPAPPEIPPRNITMPYVDSIRRTRLGYLESECESEPPYMPCNHDANKNGNNGKLATKTTSNGGGSSDTSNKSKNNHNNKNGMTMITTESSTTTTTSIPAMSMNKDCTTGPLLPVMQNSMHYVQTQSSNPSRFSTSFNHTSIYSSPFSTSRFPWNSKQCQEKFSWRCSTFVLVILLVLMCAILGYFAAVSTVPQQRKDGQPAICVTENDEATTPLPSVRFDHSHLVTKADPKPLVPKPYVASEEKIELGKEISKHISPKQFWRSKFFQSKATYVQFNLTLPRESTIGVFGRRDMLPSPLQHDFMEVISQGRLKKTKRAVRHRGAVSFTQFLELGEWNLAVYNDDEHTHTISLLPSVDNSIPLVCEEDCSGHGRCQNGECSCYPGYTGRVCSESICPVLCNDKGRYSEGVCHCDDGWKGQDCSMRQSECEVSDCNRHGMCENGKCVCLNGYKGEFCEKEDCHDPTCSNHGSCVDAVCHCKAGWKGRDCNEVDNQITRCLPNCSHHGVFDVEKEKCICEQHWSGPQCSIALCDLDCGPYGQCQNGQCICQNGWTGQRCEQRSCDERCSEHGQCNNGTCVCIQGWSGKHCSLDGCPNGCSNHGDCVKEDELDDDSWHCQCRWGWGGIDCSTLLETDCQDQKDNDGDGLVDCADSECCTNSVCRDNLICVSSPDPLDVLLRKPPPAITASFYQKMKFLIDENSVQSYPQKKEFSESRFWSSFDRRRVSVIRGQVVNKRGTGLIGIRVSVATSPKLGFTLTRNEGWFDILVNGGGAITLQFQRSPFRPTKKTVLVPWNKIVIMEKSVLFTINEQIDAEDTTITKEPLCLVHNYEKMKPIIYQTWKPGFEGGCHKDSTIYAEHQVVQESLRITGSDISLLYHSSHSRGFKSTIHLKLTPEVIPLSLRLIRLKIIIEGVIFEKKFEADANVTFTFAWNKSNVYRQKVYGLAEAKITIGYEYKDCRRVIEEVRTSYLQGYDMDISNLGGWNLNIHHRYNFDQGILQKGDGSRIYFQQGPQIIKSVMGTGEQRLPECKSNGCESDLAITSTLLAPMALATSSDGSVYVGDFNLVRKINNEGNVHTILRLSATKVSYEYYMTLSPTDGQLYISDPERHQILRVRSTDKPSDNPYNNYEITAGSGHRCLPGDKNACGDGRTAIEAKLIYPKGLAISVDGTMYFADGPAIRSIDNKSIVRTLIGNNNLDQWTPVSCTGTTLKASEVHLRWPTSVAVNPLDGSVYVLDDRLIIKITSDRKVFLVAGHWAHCHSTNYDDDKQSLSLADLVGMAFAPNGDLYIAQKNSENINQINILKPDGSLEHIAGRLTKCDCLRSNCSCPTTNYGRAPETLLSSISAIATAPDGGLYVADKGSLRILLIKPYMPSDDKNIAYEIAYPEGQEIYVFNKYGQHVMTKNIMTGKGKYTFSYNVNTRYGKLSTITDASGNKVTFLRDYNNIDNTIENAHGLKCRVKMTEQGLLKQFIAADLMKTIFTYSGSSGLLTSRIDSAGQTFIYRYDAQGRVIEAVTPVGQIISFKLMLEDDGATVIVKSSGDDMKISADDTKVALKRELSNFQVQIENNRQRIVLSNTTGRSIVMTKGGHYVLEALLPLQAGIMPMPTKESFYIDGEHVAEYGWKYLVNYDGREHSKLVTQVSRQVSVNDTHMMTAEYDWLEHRETFYDINHKPLLGIQYDSLGKPTQWLPGSKGLPLNLMYDRFGRVSSWRRGQMFEKYTYNRFGQLFEVKYMDTSTLTYHYEDEKTLPHQITLPSGKKYSFRYDTNELLEAIVTPMGSKHSFIVQTSLGFYKLFYHPPGSGAGPYVQKFRDDGKILIKVFPNESGRTLYHYNTRGQLDTIIYGKMKSEFEYNDDGLCDKESWITSEFQTTTFYSFYGNLVKGIKTKFLSKVALSNAEFNYLHDKKYNLKSIAVKIGTHELPAISYVYNERFGHIENIGAFKVSQHRENSTSLQDGVAKFVRVQDLYYRDLIYSLSVGGSEVFKIEMDYNNRNLLSKTKIKSRSMGHMTTKTHNYLYDKDGQLLEMTGNYNWKFAYDANGNMIMMNYRGNEIRLKYNDDYRIVRYANTAYTVDDRGFVTKKETERFFYNHKGLLTHAIRPGIYSVKYYYDSRDRLAVRMDNMRNVTQYFYAYEEHPNLVSHIHSPVNGKIMTLTYNDKQHLMHAQVNRENYYIVTDHLGTPTMVLNRQGEIVKEIQRGPYGQKTSDTNRNFYLPIDFHGGILDTVTGLVHFNKGRLYNTELGQWMTPAWEDIQDRISDPLSINMYRFNKNNPVNLESSSSTTSDVKVWFNQVGFDVNRVVFDANPMKKRKDSASTKLLNSLPSAGLKIKSGLLCSAESARASLRELRTVPDSLVKSRRLTTDFGAKVSSKSVPFGLGITLVKMQDGRTQIRYVQEANPIARDVYSSVFNNAHFLDVTLHHNDQDVFFFVKENTWRVSDDLGQLQRLGGIINMTVHESNSGHGSDGSAKHVDVRLTMNNVIVNILYGMQPEIGRKRLLRHAKRRAMTKKWKMVRDFIIDQTWSGKFVPAQQWTEKEKEKIRLDGFLHGYHGEYYHDVNMYPELADDPHNIVLKKNSNKKQHRNSLRRNHLLLWSKPYFGP